MTKRTESAHADVAWNRDTSSVTITAEQTAVRSGKKPASRMRLSAFAGRLRLSFLTEPSLSQSIVMHSSIRSLLMSVENECSRRSVDALEVSAYRRDERGWHLSSTAVVKRFANFEPVLLRALDDELVEVGPDNVALEVMCLERGQLFTPLPTHFPHEEGAR